jgi:hypothetical protein
VACVAHMEKTRNAYRTVVDKCEGEELFVGPRRRSILKRQDVRA